ncbi:hypothetical protein VE00_02483 [Pseudogymnoascus sp. WSF 3629]|nr:hypothetical protein VE00_02483 [Pseudogymnoascus sp. WSF 3629]
MEWPEFTNPFVGIKPPPGVHVPEREELLGSICAERSPRSGFPYPPEAPIFWIKYGFAVYWNDVCGQTVAYDGLRQIGSSVRAPGVYYAFKEDISTYIVMEYIPGKTAKQCLGETQDEAEKEKVYRSMAFAVSELHRIPIPKSRRRLAAISGERFRHNIFEFDLQATRHYENTQQFQNHINTFLRLTKRENLVHGLHQEPLVFCQADIYHGNYMIDADNRVTAIDFAESSIVPSSLAKFSARFHNLGVHISQWVDVPATEGIDNTEALLAAYGPMTMGSGSFSRVGRRIAGGDDETQNRINQALQHEVRDYPRSHEPTLREVIVAHEANEKLGEEGDSSAQRYTTEEINKFKSWLSFSTPGKPRIPRKLVEDDLS